METIQAQITLDNAKAVQELQRLNQTITNSFQSLSKTLSDSLGKVDGKGAGQKIANDISSEGKKAGVSFGDLFKSSLLANLASSGIQAAISKVFDFGKSFFDASSQMEDFRAKFNVLTKSAEKGGEILEKIFKVGAATPFETKEIAQASEMLLQYGISAEAVIGTSLRLGDISGGNAERMNGLARAYGQVASAGKANLGDINQMINNGFNPLNEIMKKTGETMGEVRERVTEGKVGYNEIKDAIIAATEPGGQFYKMMDERSKTVSGRISTLKDQITAMGMSLLGVSTAGKIVENGLFDTISRGINNLSGALGLIDWNSIGARLVTAIGTIMTALSTMANSAMLALAPLQGVFGALGQTLTLIGQGSLQVLVAGFTGLMGSIQALNIIIAPLLTMFLDLANMILPTLFSWLSMIAGPVAIATAAFFAFQGVGLIMAGVSALVSFGIFGIISSLFTLVSFIGLPVLAIGLLALAWQTNFLGIQELTVGAIQSIGGFLAGGFQGFLSGTASFLKGFVKFFNDAFVFTNQLVTGFITGCLQGMATLNTGMTTALTLILETVIGGFQFMVKGAFDVLAGFVTGVAEYALNVGDVFAGMIDFASGLLTGDWSKMVSGAGKTFGGLVGMVLAPAKAVVGIIESAINNVIDMINGVTQNSVVQAVLKEFGAEVGQINKVKFSDNFANWANNAQASAEGMVAGADAAAKATERLAKRQSTLDGIKSSISGIGEGISKAVDVSSFTKGLRDGSSEIEKMVSDYNKPIIEGSKKNLFDVEGTSKGIDEMTTKLQNMAKSAGESMKNFKLSDAMKNPLGEFQKQIDAQREKSQKEATNLMDEEKKKMANETNKAGNLGKQEKEKGGGAGKSAADKAQKEAEKQIDIQKKAQEDIDRLKAQTVGDAKTREIAMAKQATQQQIDNFKGSEGQKAEYAKLMQEKLNQDISKTNEQYNKKDLDDKKKIIDEQQKVASEQQKINEILQKSKIDAISNTQTRELEIAKLNSQNILSDFKGTESQKAEFAKSQAQILERETLGIKKKFADEVLAEQKKQSDLIKSEQEKSLKEQVKQQKEVAKTGKEYDDLIGKLAVLNQKQQEYTDKTKASTEMNDSQKVADIRQQLANLGSANFGQLGIINDGTPPISPTTPTTPINQTPQNPNIQNENQPPAPTQPPADPATLTKPIDDSAKKTTEGIDTLIEKIKTGISGAIGEGSKAIVEEIIKMDEECVKIFNLVNEGWITIAQAIGQNVINGIISGLQKGERSIYSAIASLETGALKAVNIEVKSREQFGEKEGRGAALGVPNVMNPNVELMRGFKPYSAGNKTNNQTQNNQKIINNNGNNNFYNNQDFEVVKGQMNAFFVG